MKEVVLQVDEYVKQSEDVVEIAKYYAYTVNYARIYVSYIVFIISIVASVLIIFGVVSSAAAGSSV